MNKKEFDTITEKATKLVNEARQYFLNNPLQDVTEDDKIIKNILLGMKFQVSNINYVTKTVTFTLVE